MNPSSVMLTREFCRNVRPAAFTGVRALLIVISIHVLFGFGDSPSPLLVALCIYFADFVFAGGTPRSHHLNLPLSASHIARVQVANAWLVSCPSQSYSI